MLSGLTASSANEFCEVALGGLITVPAAVALMDWRMETPSSPLEKKYGSRFTPPKLLEEMAAKGETFYGRFAPKKAAA